MKDLNDLIRHEKESWDNIFDKKLHKTEIRFNKFSSFWDEDYYLKLKKIVEIFIERYNYKKILEAGSGSGRSSIILDCNDLERTLLDISPAALRYAKRVAKNFDVKKIELVNGNIFNMPFANREFDFVWNTGVIEHYDDAAIYMIIKEMVRVVKSNGMIALGVPNFFSGPSLKAYIFKYLPSFIPGYRLETENFYNNKIILDLLIKACRETKRNIEWTKVEYFGNPLPLESPKWLIKTFGLILDVLLPHNRFMIMFFCKLKDN